MIKNKLLIATSNKHRYLRLQSLISTLEINIVTVSLDEIDDIPALVERGDEVLDVVRQKIQHYSAYYKEPFLVEDDGLFMNTINSPNARIKRGRFETNVEVFNYWYKHLSNNGPIKGKLIKAYGLCVNNHSFLELLEIQVDLIPLKRWPKKICYNPLNHFIKPKDCNNVIENFNQNDRMIYNEGINKILKKILINI